MRDELSNTAKPDWVVCQIGAREHYSLAAEFARQGRLDALVTDCWVPPGSLIARLARLAGGAGRALQERYRDRLSDARVLTIGAPSLVQEISGRLEMRLAWSWEATHQTNQRLGRAFADTLVRSRVLEQLGPRVVFAYSYGALEVLQAAKAHGATAILGQIDPGLGETKYVEAIAAGHNLPEDSAQVPGPDYWARWREECAVADKIVVNSPWSRELLIGEGIPGAKIMVAPLAFEAEASTVTVSTPPQVEGPIKLLFLGQVSVRKGILELLEACRNFDDHVVHLSVVGPIEERVKRLLQTGLPKNVTLFGRVARSEAIEHYRRADVFVLPTHSDGFGLTQLEAMSNGLPVIASRNCGSVVRHAVDGLLLNSVTPQEIINSIGWFCTNRRLLGSMKANARERVADFMPDRIVQRLDAVAMGLSP